jgi:hypothetical protein
LVKVSKDQLKLLEDNTRRARSRLTADQLNLVANDPRSWCDISGDKPARARKRKEELPENILEKQITDFLAFRAFVNNRQQVGLFVPFGVLKQLQIGQLKLEDAARNIVHIGEEGMADWWSARPVIPPGGRPLGGPHLWQGFFWEAKAPGKRPSEVQLDWLRKRRQVGFEAAWFDQFEIRDRPVAAGDPSESHVFEIWFFGYFVKVKRGTEVCPSNVC